MQYSQGLPGVILEKEKQNIYIDTTQESYSQDLESAYEHYLTEDFDYFAISQDYAAGLYEFLHNASLAGKSAFIKGHTIGPISFGLTVTDQNKRASIYNQEFCDCLLKVLSIKARWQIRKLRSACGAAKIIIFIDEPYLVSVGSSFFNIQQDQVKKMLNEVIAAIHQEGAFAGIHCCGNTDWSIVLKTDVDILNFDAYNYLDNLFLYREELNSFLKRHGVLAWGIVPTTIDGALPSAKVLQEKMSKQKGPCLITPSCGLSGLALQRAEEALCLASSLAKSLPLA